MNISWQFLHSLEDEHGDAFYLLDLKAFEDNYAEFLQSFCDIYPKTRIAYSYKTNYLPKLCQCVDLWGGYAEVVSRLEYDLALRLGASPERIIFNGPYKDRPAMEKALLAGSIVNLDAPYEVEIVEAIAMKNLGHELTVGLRCNFDVGTGTMSRFGFDVTAQEFTMALEALGRVQNCHLGGLHCHFLLPQRSPESYARVASKMLDLAMAYIPRETLRFVDLGGGFMSKMSPHLQEQFPFPVPSYREYAESIAPLFASAFPDQSGPELILEPGIGIVADVMKFVAKVIEIKQLRSRTVALVSGSVYNVKPTKSSRNLPLRVIGDQARPVSAGSGAPLDIVGYTCMEDDCLYTNYEGQIAVGDYVMFDNVGAYTLVLKPPFILPSPPVLAYEAGSPEIEVVKRQEELADVFATYVF